MWGGKKHVDAVVNSIQTLTVPITNAISNTHNNPRPQVGFLQLVYQHLLIQINILFLIKLVVHTTIQHHIPRIKLFFKEVNHV